MKKLSVIAGGVFLVFGLAVMASAQMGMRQAPVPRGLFNPVVGAGAQYEITQTEGRKTDMEFDIVGKESVDGKNGYWMEYTIGGMPRGDVVVKVLTVFDGTTVATSRMIMQMAGAPPMEMPAQMMNTARTNQSATILGQADEVGTESVTTPAGTFSCKHYRMKDGSGDTWVSDKVSPFGVVKYTGKDSTTVLTKTVSDAKDKITGTPQPFNPAAMMQQRGPQ